MRTIPPRILVLLGTDHHPFLRAVQWAEALHDQFPGAPTVLVQHGYTPAPTDPRSRYVDFMGHHELLRELARTQAVVCHGGPATIADCRAAGLLPVVVPRRHDLGEHVDDHQQLYTCRLADAGLIERATTVESFRSALETGLTRPRRDLSGEDEISVAATVSRFEELVSSALARQHRKR